jgi:hypothetical protein
MVLNILKGKNEKLPYQNPGFGREVFCGGC